MTEYPVGSVRTTARIVRALEDNREAGVTELADELDISKASVHNHLTTLERLGVVVSDAGRYRLGLRFLDIGIGVRDGMVLHQVPRPEVAGLAQSTRDHTSSVVPSHNEAVSDAVAASSRNACRIRLV